MYSAYSAQTKLRSRYGNMFRKTEYKELISCKSIYEIASYLKNTPKYNALDITAKDNEVHRGVLESNLRHLSLESNIKLCTFERYVGEHFYEFIMEEEEVILILEFLRHILSGHSDTFYTPHSLFFDEHTHIDFDLLSGVSDYNEFLKRISRSKFYSIIYPHIPKNGENIDLTVIEKSLYTKLYNDLNLLIKKYNSSESAKELYELLYTYLETKNISVIYRMKKYYNASKENILLITLPFQYKLSKNDINRLLECNTDDFANILKDTPYKELAENDMKNIELMSRKLLFKKCTKTMRYSKNPHAVTMAYLFLSDIEIENIIIITEGIRYSLAPDEIEKMLVY